MYRAVAWDIDGTLVDSEPLHHDGLLAACAAQGVDISDLPDETFVGINLFGVWEALAPRFPAGAEREGFIADINAYCAANAARLRAMPHAAEVIRILHAAGTPQVAVSNSHRVVVDANLEYLGVTAEFGFSLALDDVPVGKPDPTPYLMLVDRLGQPAGEVLAVEDSASGVASARAAGLPVALYAPNGGSLPDADHVIRSLRDVLDLIRSEHTHGL